MADSADTNGAAKPSPLLFSVPTEVFNNIISHASKHDLRSLSRTCRLFRFGEILIPGIYFEPLSRDDFPLTKKRLDAISISPDFEFKHEKRGPEVYGFAAEMHDVNGLCDDYMSIIGLGGVRDQDYMTVRDLHEILQKLDKRTGSYVKSLTIPDFLTIDDIRPFADYCPNIENLDLETFMHNIDYVEEDGYRTHLGFPYGLDVHQLVEDCSSLFKNVRSVKIAYLGSRRTSSDSYEKSRASFNKLLAQAQKLRCLEIHNRNAFYGFPGYRYPERAVDLINSLASNASPQLTELRLYDMTVIFRSLPILLKELKERLPKLSKIAISITEDLERIALDLDDHEDPEFTDLETAIYHETPRTGWDYLRMLHIVCEDPDYKVTSLEGQGYCELNPLWVYSDKDSLDWMGPRVEVFKSLKKHMSWSPTFHWHDQMYRKHHDVNYILNEISEPQRKKELDSIRDVFQTVKEADLPVKLLVDTTRRRFRHSQEENMGTFFVRVLKPLQLHPSHPRFPRAEQGDQERFGPRQWYLKAIGDLVDEFTIRWGHKAIREPTFDQFSDPIPHIQYRRPRHEIVREEKSMVSSLWTDLAETFPSLKRLEVHIPDEIYIGDEEMTKLLPGEGWTMECGKDVLVKDFRKDPKIVNLGPVNFLTRIWTKTATDEMDICSDVEGMKL